MSMAVVERDERTPLVQARSINAKVTRVWRQSACLSIAEILVAE